MTQRPDGETGRRLPLEKASRDSDEPKRTYLPPDIPRLPLTGVDDPKMVQAPRKTLRLPVGPLSDAGPAEEIEPLFHRLGYARLAAPPRSLDDPLRSGWRVRELRASTHSTLRNLIAEKRETDVFEREDDPLGSGWALSPAAEPPIGSPAAPAEPTLGPRSPETVRAQPVAPPARSSLYDALMLVATSSERRRNLCTKCGARLSPPAPGEAADGRVCEACAYFEKWVQDRYQETGHPTRLWERRMQAAVPQPPRPPDPLERLVRERGFSSIFSLAGALARRPSLDESLKEAPIERSRKVQILHRLVSDPGRLELLVPVLANNTSLHSRTLEILEPELPGMLESRVLEMYRQANDAETRMKLEYLLYREIGTFLDQQVRSRGGVLAEGWERFAGESQAWVEEHRALLATEPSSPCPNFMAEVIGLYLLDGLNYTTYLEGNVPSEVRRVLDVLLADGLLQRLLGDAERAVRKLIGA
ncbi:MAG: hypothetical protein HY319_23455 [Armatimonadetes bacterium]|nr:hypothetical protein [Armatimonadota bacterium]